MVKRFNNIVSFATMTFALLLIYLITTISLDLVIDRFCSSISSTDDDGRNYCSKDKPSNSHIQKMFNNDRQIQSKRAVSWLNFMRAERKSFLSSSKELVNVEENRKLSRTTVKTIHVVVCIISVTRTRAGGTAGEDYLLETMHSVWNQLIRSDFKQKINFSKDKMVVKIKDYDSEAVGASGRIRLEFVPVLCLPDMTEAIYDDIIQVITAMSAPWQDGGQSSAGKPGIGISNEEKELQDYRYCLRQSLEEMSGAQYLLVLEDDAPLLEMFKAKLANVIAQIENHQTSPAFVKLSHPERLRKANYYPQIVAFSIAWVGLIICASFKLLLQLDLSLFGNKIFRILICVIGCCLVYKSSAGLIHALSPNALALMRYRISGSVYLTVPESCCTQALLFPVESIKAVMESLENESTSSGRAKDHILDEASRKLGLATLMSDHNLVAHIGRYSTLHSHIVPAQSLG